MFIECITGPLFFSQASSKLVLFFSLYVVYGDFCISFVVRCVGFPDLFLRL